MSLFKQLWLAIALLLLLVFSGSFVVSSLSARAYLEQQLTMKNADNANALALSLTQQGADEVMLELTLSAQFDTGFYELIELRDPEGNVLIHREDDQPIEDAPGWFVSLFPIDVEPGIAAVQQGWQQLGIITLRSHSKFAYEELWESSLKLAGVCLAAMIGAGLLGSLLLRFILRPLGEVVEQTEAIGDRRFITIAEPNTREFRQVVRAMNRLSGRIRGMLDQEAKRLEKWQREAQIDKVTKLINREPFIQALDASLESDDVNATGSCSLLRLCGLAELNKSFGRPSIDGMLVDVGTAMNTIARGHSRWAAARLNGSDFALLAPRATEALAAVEEAQEAILDILEQHGMRDACSLPGTGTIYHHGETFGEIMTRLDQALVASEEEGESRLIEAFPGGQRATGSLREQLEEWRAIFETAFRDRLFILGGFTAVDLRGDLLHTEAPVRLKQGDEILSAGTFLPWLNRLELSYLLDREVLRLGLERIGNSGEPLAINLSVAAVVETDFVPWLNQAFASSDVSLDKLWVEIPEAMAFRHLAKFRELAAVCKRYDVKIGIEHVGHQLANLGDLSDIGVDYLKVDASFIRAIDQNVANQTLLRTLCAVGHSIGVLVLAELVRSEEEWETLKELGIDGATGPFFAL